MKKPLMLRLLVLSATALCAGGSSFAATGDDLPVIDTTSDFGAPQRSVIHFYGVTLGPDWQGFPAVLMPDYTATGSSDRLDVTLPLYIDWELEANVVTGCPDPGDPTPVTPARALADEDWYADLYDQFIVGGVDQDLSDTEYHTCGPGDGLEAPQADQLAGLTADGELNVLDVHGGVGNSTIIWMYATVGNPLDPIDAYVLVLRWNKVATYTDIVTMLGVNAVPGTAVRRPYSFHVGGPGGPFCDYTIWSSVVAVQWPSADIAGASVRRVDAGDIAMLASKWQNPVDWGFDPHPENWNYFCNVAPFGSSSLFLDTGDLSALAEDLGKQCGLSKAGSAADRAAILDWFGIAATGSDVVVGPNGESVPEYTIADWAKCQRAIADPYGYRGLASVRESPWGRIKELYR